MIEVDYSFVHSQNGLPVNDFFFFLILSAKLWLVRIKGKRVSDMELVKTDEALSGPSCFIWTLPPVCTIIHNGSNSREDYYVMRSQTQALCTVLSIFRHCISSVLPCFFLDYAVATILSIKLMIMYKVCTVYCIITVLKACIGGVLMVSSHVILS